MIRPLWTAAGLVCLALGWLGLILPLMPGALFLLAALYCFSRGHPAWAVRLLEHPVYGPPLRHWRDHRAIARRSKLLAFAGMAVAALATWLLIGFPLALVSWAALIAVAIWIWRQPEPA